MNNYKECKKIKINNEKTSKYPKDKLQEYNDKLVELMNIF